MTHTAFYFNHHNTKFYGQYWQATSTVAVVILVHGMGEHSTRYADSVVPKFLENNISVITYDQFGHGRTEGKRGHNPNYEAVLDCVKLITDKVNTIFGDLPTFLYGHSMGGNVIVNYILTRKHNFTGAIATSPFFKLAFQPPSWKLIIGSILQKIAPSITMDSELEISAISRDKNEIQKYINDPLVHDKISANYSLTFIKKGIWAIENASRLNTALLIIHGTGDRLTSYKASEEFVKNTTNNTTIKLFENGFHELHNDTCKEEMLETVLNWTNLQLKTNLNNKF